MLPVPRTWVPCVSRASGDTPDRLVRTIIVFAGPKNNRYHSAGLPAEDPFDCAQGRRPAPEILNPSCWSRRSTAGIILFSSANVTSNGRRVYEPYRSEVCWSLSSVMHPRSVLSLAAPMPWPGLLCFSRSQTKAVPRQLRCHPIWE